jgi:hypothetical protein
MAMMPNPALFPDPVDYYLLDTWPAGVRLHPDWIQASRSIKEQLLGSPLLPRTTGIVSREYGTVAAVRAAGDTFEVASRTGPGDGTVPIRAAAVAELKDLYEARGNRHADLMKNQQVINAVADLVRSGETDALPTLRIEDIDFDEVLPETEAMEPSDDALEGVRGRMDEGRLSAADVDWLLDPLATPPPP